MSLLELDSTHSNSTSLNTLNNKNVFAWEQRKRTGRWTPGAEVSGLNIVTRGWGWSKCGNNTVMVYSNNKRLRKQHAPGKTWTETHGAPNNGTCQKQNTSFSSLLPLLWEQSANTHKHKSSQNNIGLLKETVVGVSKCHLLCLVICHLGELSASYSANEVAICVSYYSNHNESIGITMVVWPTLSSPCSLLTQLRPEVRGLFHTESECCWDWLAKRHRAMQNKYKMEIIFPFGQMGNLVFQTECSAQRSKSPIRALG